jgi:hypothetical protein
MQPATVTGGAVTQLSQEQLQSLTVAAGVLRKEVGEVIKDVIDYPGKLGDVAPIVQLEATQRLLDEL